MTIDDLIAMISRSAQHTSLYHFTDERNLPLIAAHGLLSKNEMRLRGIWPTAPGGNQLSHSLDDWKGVSSYVSLCLTKSHPMLHVAKNEGRVDNVRYLRIHPQILKTEGVLFAPDIANKGGVMLTPLAASLGVIDTEVTYYRTEWRDPSIQNRLKAIERYEVLVPTCITPDFISGL
jgi:hypothetical protein